MIHHYNEQVFVEVETRKKCQQLYAKFLDIKPLEQHCLFLLKICLRLTKISALLGIVKYKATLLILTTNTTVLSNINKSFNRKLYYKMLHLYGCVFLKHQITGCHNIKQFTIHLRHLVTYSKKFNN